MAAARPTFQQRLFSDEELPLPEHDRIVRWVDKSFRAMSPPLCAALGIEHSVSPDGITVTWDKRRYESGAFDRETAEVTKLGEGLLLTLAGPIPPPIPILCKMVEWEIILKDERNTIIGAVDLMANIAVLYPLIRAEVERVWKVNEDLPQ